MSDIFVCKISFVGLLVLFAPVTFGKTCWESTWYNSSAPANHGGSDNESQPIDVLKTLCPDGSPAIDAQCKDEKGEPFRGFKNDVSSKYVANCTVETGLICLPYSDGHCADFAIQYGCACPTTLPPQTTPPGGSGAGGPSSNAIVNGGAGSTSGPVGSPSGIVSSPSGIVSSPSGIGSSQSGFGSSPSSIGSSPSSIGSSPSSIGSSPSGIASSPSGIGSSLSGIGSSPSGIGSSPSGIISGLVGSGPSGSSTGNTNGEGSTGGGTYGQSVGNGSSGSPGGRNSSENGSNGNSAFGSYCPCRNGSHKIDGTFYAVLLNVLFMLR